MDIQKAKSTPKSKTAQKPYSLDFQIKDAQERLRAIQSILNSPTASKLTQSDYDLFTSYLCCGIDPGEEKSPVQKKEIELNPYHKKEESLEALLEAPTFNETTSFQTIPYTIPRPNFDRTRITDPHSIQLFTPLWNEIDKIDRILRIRAEKPVSPPPSPEERARALSLSPNSTYKLKHLLIDLRREQYNLSDQLLPPLQRKSLLQSTYRGGESDSTIAWGNGFYEIAPLGFYKETDPKFTTPYLPSPSYQYDETAPATLDFRNPKHIYQINEFREQLEDYSYGDSESTIPLLYSTFDFYTSLAQLPPYQTDILILKSQNYTNQFIAAHLHTTYSLTYSDPYISTIYTQQICADIAAAASLHYDTYLARTSPTNFKPCKDCGAILLRDPRNFTHYARSKDGYMCRCKRCEKKKRDQKKVKSL